MEAVKKTEQTRRFALIALGVLLLERVIIACLFVLEDNVPFLQGILLAPAIPIDDFQRVM